MSPSPPHRPSGDVYSVGEVAAAAAVSARRIQAAVESEQIRQFRGFLSAEDAVRLVRWFGQAGSTAGRLLAPHEGTRRRAGLPIVVSSTLHALFGLAMLIASSLGLLSARDTDQAIKDPTPVRLVFMVAPGPGGGGGGGGNNVPLPPPRAERKAPTPRRVSNPVPPPRPQPPPRPIIRDLPPPAVVPPKPDPLPTVIAPIVTMAANLRDRSGLPVEPAVRAPAASQGPGTGGGVGTGRGTGLGPGDGSGIGDGSGGGIGGGPFRPGSGIEPPALVREVRPVYTDDARRRAIEGDVLLEIVVRRDGSVGQVRVMQTLGAGLEQRAIDAVRQWKFSPARRSGAAVDVVVEVAVGFSLKSP